MLDREILTQLKDQDVSRATKLELKTELWGRYSRLVHKNWAILRKQMDNSSIILEQEDDYYSEAYIAFNKALDAIKLEKIRDDKWKFIGYYRLYLKNVRTAFISKTRQRVKHEVANEIPSRGGPESDVLTLTDIASAEAAVLTAKLDPLNSLLQSEAENNCSRAVRLCMEKWDPTRKKIFRLRESGSTKGDVAKALGVHPATITYYLKGMRADMEEALSLGDN